MHATQMGSYSGAPEIHSNVSYFIDKQPLERIYMDAIQSIFILSVRTYINTRIILLPDILHSILSCTLFRTFQSLRIMVGSCTHLPFTWLAWITFVGVIICSVISFSVALVLLTKVISRLCPSFNLKAFEWQQLKWNLAIYGVHYHLPVSV